MLGRPTVARVVMWQSVFETEQESMPAAERRQHAHGCGFFFGQRPPASNSRKVTSISPKAPYGCFERYSRTASVASVHKANATS